MLINQCGNTWNNLQSCTCWVCVFFFESVSSCHRFSIDFVFLQSKVLPLTALKTEFSFTFFIHTGRLHLQTEAVSVAMPCLSLEFFILVRFTRVNRGLTLVSPLRKKNTTTTTITTLIDKTWLVNYHVGILLHVPCCNHFLFSIVNSKFFMAQTFVSWFKNYFKNLCGNIFRLIYFSFSSLACYRPKSYGIAIVRRWYQWKWFNVCHCLVR